VRLFERGQQWTFQFYDTYDATPRVIVERPYSTSGGLSVYSSSRGDLLLEDIEESRMLHVGPMREAKEWMSVAVPQLRPGSQYRLHLRGDEDAESLPFRPIWRRGSPQGFGRLDSQHGELAASVAYVGSEHFGIRGKVLMSEPMKPGTIQHRVWVAFVDPAEAERQVTVRGEIALLQPQVEYRNTETLNPNYLLNPTGVSILSPTGVFIPIPDDPTLEGKMLLCQLVWVGPGEDDVSLTEVCGVLVRPRDESRRNDQLRALQERRWQEKGRVGPTEETLDLQRRIFALGAGR
jgi:hypothetical protein